MMQFKTSRMSEANRDIETRTAGNVSHLHSERIAGARNRMIAPDIVLSDYDSWGHCGSIVVNASKPADPYMTGLISGWIQEKF
jgi:hypothetical protein